MAKKKKRSGHDAQWAEAKRRCRLSIDDVRMAKELGLDPRKLIKNIPCPSQQWKQPVKFWIRELYARKHPPAASEPAPPDEVERIAPRLLCGTACRGPARLRPAHLG
jgi:hypothetical protein